MSTPKPNGPKAPAVHPSHADSIPSGLLDDLLDRERAAEEKAKALGPEFQSAAQELRDKFNLRPSQPLLQWDSLVEEGARPPVVDHQALRARVEGELGAPAPSQALSDEASPAPPPVVSPKPERAIQSPSVEISDEPSADGVSAQTAQLEVAKLGARRLYGSEKMRTRWMRVLIAAGVMGFGVGFGGAAVFAGSPKSTTKNAAKSTEVVSTTPSVVASPPRSVAEPMVTTAIPVPTPSDLASSSPSSSASASATATATAHVPGPQKTSSLPNIPTVPTTSPPATTPTATAPASTGTGTQPYFQRGNLQ